MDAELLFRPVTDLADLVRSGEVSSRELVEGCLERIEALNGELNAFIVVDAEGALAAADAVAAGESRPFAGVPIAIKDTAAVAGLPFSLGSELFGDFVPEHDAFVVRRLRDAGFVIVGKTNLPEFGILPVSEPRRWGPARNPGTPSARRAARPAARRRRSPRAWSRSPTEATAAARSASPRRAAGWSG